MLQFYWDFGDMTDFVERSLDDKKNGIGKYHTEQKVIDFVRRFIVTGASFGFCCIDSVDDDCMLFVRNPDSKIISTQETDVMLMNFCRYSFAKNLEKQIGTTSVLEISRSPFHTTEVYEVNIHFTANDFQRIAYEAPSEYIKTMTPDMVKSVNIDYGSGSDEGEPESPTEKAREVEVAEARVREEEQHT